MKPAKRRATYDDLRNVPETLVAEIIEGELYTSPRPGGPHTNAASVIGGDINGAFHRPPGSSAGPGGWWILFEPELHLGPDVLVPDLAGWQRQRLPKIEDVAYFEVVPDWICEVVSPRTAAIDRVRKMRIYAREGVATAWLVDPLAKTLEVYRLEGKSWVLEESFDGAGHVRVAPFDAVEIDLSRWWLED
jgi:Uma2 family endonuclease